MAAKVFEKILTDDSNTHPDTARLRAAATPHAGDWLHAPSITAVGLRLSDEAIHIAAGFRLESRTCQPHDCVCSAMVDAKGLHGLSCTKSAPRQIRHAQMNDIIWRFVKKAQYPAVKEPVGVSRSDVKRPDGATMIPWTRGKPLAWNAIIPDTFANLYWRDSDESDSSGRQSGLKQNDKVHRSGQDAPFRANRNRDRWCLE